MIQECHIYCEYVPGRMERQRLQQAQCWLDIAGFFLHSKLIHAARAIQLSLSEWQWVFDELYLARWLLQRQLQRKQQRSSAAEKRKKNAGVRKRTNIFNSIFANN